MKVNLFAIPEIKPPAFCTAARKTLVFNGISTPVISRHKKIGVVQCGDHAQAKKEGKFQSVLKAPAPEKIVCGQYCERDREAEVTNDVRPLYGVVPKQENSEQ